MHADLHPGNILLTEDGRTVITHFEYARSGSHRALTIAREIVDDLEKNIKPAGELGMKTVLFKNIEQMKEELSVILEND